MTAKQILDAFSETLMQDERILSSRERDFLLSLLQNSKAVSSHNLETQSAVSEAIARSVGETVAQRAFAVLGSSIVEQILARSGILAQTEFGVPQPPSGPQPNTVPQPPSAPQPNIVPQPPSGPQGFRPLSVSVQRGAQPGRIEPGSGVGVLEAPAIARAQCVVLEEFLAPQELDELVSYALQHEAEFQSSEVISPSGDPGVIDYNHRRSRVLLQLGKHHEVMLERLQYVLPRVLDQLGIEEFSVAQTELQITSSNDGDFFRAHSDDAQATISSRRLTFVYFFHREPRQFEGGELRIYDSYWKGEQPRSTGSYQNIVPQQNQIVFFPCSMLHEITPVKCPSRAFADSRFTLNGWLHS